MPVTPLPPSNTRRYFLDYSVGGIQHTLTCRTTGTVSAGTAAVAIDGFLSAFGTTLHELTVIGFRISAAGSDVSLPVNWPEADTYGTGALTGANRARFSSITGRSTAGRKARVDLYGLKENPNASWRFLPTDFTWVSAAITALGATTGCFTAIDGLPVDWHAYVNINMNDHWVDEFRKT